MAREALRSRGLELPERRLYVPDRRIHVPGREVEPPLRRAITVTNIGTAASSGNVSSITVAAVAVPSGSLVVVPANDGNTAATAGSVTDTQSNSYSLLTTVHPNNSAVNGIVQLFWSVLTTALTASDTIKFTPSGSHVVAMSAFYATGCAASSPVDTAVTATAAGSSTTASGTGGTPGQSGELWVGVVGSTTHPTITNSGSWATPPNTGSNLCCVGGGTQVGGASAPSYSASLSTSSAWGLIIAAFKPAAADVLMPQILM